MRLIDADVLIEHLLEVMETANEFGDIERVSEIGGCIGVIKGEKTIEPQCKFRSPKNCDFCAFHSDCEEHWKEGDEKQ